MLKTVQQNHWLDFSNDESAHFSDHPSPYFYIIQHKASGKKYAGIRYSKNCHPSELLTKNGYKTSSKIIKEIIKNEGLESFRILEIKIFDDAKSCKLYEIQFLGCNNCRLSGEWFNISPKKSNAVENILPTDIKKALKIRELPSYEYLHECFEYDKDTGMLKWKIRPLRHFKNSHIANNWNSRTGNKICKNKHPAGYIQVGINGFVFLTHRIIWKMVTGNDPKALIDHINGVKNDNRFDNLREASASENNMNVKKYKNNTSQYKCIKFNESTKMFMVRVKINRKPVTVGYFTDIETAYDAYLSFIKENFGEFANDGNGCLILK